MSRAAAAIEETPANNDVNAPPAGQSSELVPVESPDDRWQRIALDAYYRAERRGFAPGGELDDWLAAENQQD